MNGVPSVTVTSGVPVNVGVAEGAGDGETVTVGVKVGVGVGWVPPEENKAELRPKRRQTIPATNNPQAQGPFPELSGREREVLDLLARGISNAEIAGTLVISQKTVRNHVSNIFNKLQVADRSQAILRARDAGLG